MGTKGAITREEEKGTGKDSKDDKEKEGKEDEGTFDSSKGIKEETKSPMKPPVELEIQSKKCNKANDNEGKEGTANEEDPFPHKVEAHRKGLMTDRTIQPVQM